MLSALANPYVLGGCGALMLLTHSAAYLSGRGDGLANAQAKYAQAAEAAMKAMRKGQARIEALDTAYRAAARVRQDEVRTIYHEVQNIVERPVYDARCVDADGVGLLDRAADHANRPLSGGTAR